MNKTTVGLTSKDIKQFEDIRIKANDIQIRELTHILIQEVSKRYKK